MTHRHTASRHHRSPCLRVSACSVAAGMAGIGLSWLWPIAAPATLIKRANVELVTSDSVVVLPGSYDTVVLPSGNVINFPFGGDGFNNFFGPGETGADGAAADPTATPAWDSVTTAISEISIPFLDTTVVLPGSGDTFYYLSSPLSGNAINLPFVGDGANDFFGTVINESASTSAGTGASIGLPSLSAEPLPTGAVVMPGSADTVVLPSFNTINLPLGGDGENNFFGGGNGGDGGSGVGVGLGDGASAADPSSATSTADTYQPGAGESLIMSSFNTINLPFGGDAVNNFFGGGDGGDGGDGIGIGIAGTGVNSTGVGVGVGGDGGEGGDGPEFFPIHITFVGSDESGAASPASASALDTDGNASGTAIGLGGDGGDGGSGAELFPMNLDVFTADLGPGASSSLYEFLDSLVGDDNSSADAGQGAVELTAAGTTGIGIDGSGGSGGSAAQFSPITMDWDDASGVHSVTVSPAELFDDWIDYLGGGASSVGVEPGIGLGLAAL